jgi:membrane-associated protein
MGILKTILDYVLHIDKNLLILTQQYGIWTYVILFIVLFMETGVIVTPFLPGDSLLFAAGSLSALGAFNIWILWAVCVVAAFAGDTANYWIGRIFGKKLYESNNRFLKKEHFDKAHAFYEKHGGFAIVLARFVPIVRTFAPCVAGMSNMSYHTFMLYNLLGGVLWVSLFVLSGFFLGNIPFVKHNFELVMVFIVLISVVPIMMEVIKSKREKKAA